MAHVNHFFDDIFSRATVARRCGRDTTNGSGPARVDSGGWRSERIRSPLDAVAIEYQAARKLLDGVPLIDATRFYSQHHGRGIKHKSIAGALDGLIAAKTAKGVS